MYILVIKQKSSRLGLTGEIYWLRAPVEKNKRSKLRTHTGERYWSRAP